MVVEAAAMVPEVPQPVVALRTAALRAAAIRARKRVGRRRRRMGAQSERRPAEVRPVPKGSQGADRGGARAAEVEGASAVRVRVVEAGEPATVKAAGEKAQDARAGRPEVQAMERVALKPSSGVATSVRVLGVPRWRVVAMTLGVRVKLPAGAVMVRFTGVEVEGWARLLPE